MTDLVVVIATAARPVLLERTLASLVECRKPATYRETIVVENGPSTDSQEVVERYARSLGAGYLHSAVPNKSLALNAALEALDDVLVFFTDDDVRLDPGVLEAYAEVAAHCPSGSYFGGPMGVDYERAPEPQLKRHLPASAAGWEPDDPDNPNLEFMGINWAAYKKDLSAVGGFDPERGPGGHSGATGQEMAMQEKLRRAGCTAVFVPEARVWHYVPESRCSPDWVLDRSYRSGMSYGLDRTSEDTPSFLLTGWVVKRSLTTWGNSARALLSGTSDDRFAAAVKRKYNHGLRKGVRTGRRSGRTESRTERDAVGGRS